MVSAALQANLDSQTVRLSHFISLLQQISEATAVPNEPSLRRTLLHASVIKLVNSGMAARLLGQAGCVEEILSMGRTMVEVTVNAAYLQHAPDRELEHFLHFYPEIHPRSEGHALSLAAPDQAESVLSRLGKQIRRSLPAVAPRRADPSWSGRSLLDRALIADDASHIPVMSLLVRRCYPRGHAAMLGTMGSLEYFVSALHGTEAADPARRTIALTEALFAINLCLFTLAFYLSAFFNLNMDRAIEQAASSEGSPSLTLNVTPGR